MGRITWLGPNDPADAFPPVEAALNEPDGLLAAGGDLSSERLLYAYRKGIFPWYDEGQPLLWWSPDPRCVLRPGDFRLSRRNRRYIRQSGDVLRFNTAFADVIRACAGPRRSQQGTWITSDMVGAYERLHAEGWAHSVEVWRDDRLVGGLYGIAIGRAFFGESMWSAEPNTSKTALLCMARCMDKGDFGLLDCQVLSQHLVGLGATVIPRSEFLSIMEPLCQPVRRFENWPSDHIPAVELLRE